MKQSKIKSISHNGTWESNYGTMHKQRVEFEDGTILVANSKEYEPPYKVGDVMEYHVTGEYQGVKNGKVSKPQEGGGSSSGYSKDPEVQKQIVRQSCLRASCDLYAQSNTDHIKVVATAQYFYDWCMTGEIKAKEETDETPF